MAQWAIGIAHKFFEIYILPRLAVSQLFLDSKTGLSRLKISANSNIFYILRINYLESIFYEEFPS